MVQKALGIPKGGHCEIYFRAKDRKMTLLFYPASTGDSFTLRHDSQRSSKNVFIRLLMATGFPTVDKTTPILEMDEMELVVDGKSVQGIQFDFPGRKTYR